MKIIIKIILINVFDYKKNKLEVIKIIYSFLLLLLTKYIVFSYIPAAVGESSKLGIA